MARWNVNVPQSEYYGPLPTNPRGVIALDPGPLIRELENTVEIAIDSETTGLDNMTEQVLYWSIAWGNRRATLHASLLPWFRHLFEDRQKTWIFANAKFDMHMFANMGMQFLGKLWCTQVMHSLLFDEMSHRLKDMAQHLLGWRWSDFQDTFGKINKNFSAGDLIAKAERENFPLLVEYAANDSWGTMGVKRVLQEMLQQAGTHSLFRTVPPYIETLWDLFTKVEAPYTRVLWNNERMGVLIDQQHLEDIRPKAEHEIQMLERRICHEAGWLINSRSTPDLRKYFFDQCKLTPRKMTKGGQSGNRQPSVDESFLEWASEQGNPVAKMVLEQRNLEKILGTYIVGIGDFLDSHGRIHTHFNQDTTRTGRLSSSGPNLQNIPTEERDKWGIRKAFIAPEGYVLIVADFNQLEMRLLAAAAREQDMIDIFLRGWDIHMGNASMMRGIPYDEIVYAKDIDKKVKAGKIDHAYMTARVLECLAARAQAKNIGFGQPSAGRSKTLSKRGNLKARAQGNPVLPTVLGSVSTCGRRPTQFAAAA
jgi:DNA polymerase I